MTSSFWKNLAASNVATNVAVALLAGLVGVLVLPPGRLPYPPGGTFSDVTLAHWPNAAYLRESVWGAGQWPLWRTTEMLGAPFAANPLSKVWYPPQWLALVPGLSITLALDLLIYAHLAWGALGMLAWAKASHLSRLAGTIGALAFALNPKTFAHLGAGHLDLVYAMAWAAWLMWAIRRYADAPSYAAAALTGVAAAALALADVRLAVYALGAGALFAVALRWKAMHGTLACMVLALLMAVYLVPLAALGPSLTRAAITPGEAGAFSLPPSYLLGLLVADTGGFHEWMTYLGLPALALAGLALRTRRREVIVWWIIVALAGLYALGDHTPLYRGLLAALPTLNWLRVPARAWFVVVVGVAHLSAWGAQSLLDAGLGRAGRLASAGALVAGLVVAGAGMTGGYGALLGFGLALAGTGLALLLTAWPRMGVRGSVVALGSVLLASLIAVNVTLVESRRETEVFAPVANQLGTTGRVYSPSFSLLPHDVERAGLLTLHGVNPFQLAWSAEVIGRAAGVTGGGYSITAPGLPPDGDPSSALRDAQPNVALLGGLAVRHVVSEFPIDAPGLRPESLTDSGNLYIYEVENALPLAYLVAPDVGQATTTDAIQTTQGEAQVTALTPDRVAVNVDGPGEALLVVTQAWAPGWRAWVDGSPVDVVRVWGVAQGVAVSAGRHRVELAYRPLPDFAGMAITGLTTLALAVWGWTWQRRTQ